MELRKKRTSFHDQTSRPAGHPLKHPHFDCANKYQYYQSINIATCRFVSKFFSYVQARYYSNWFTVENVITKK